MSVSHLVLIASCYYLVASRSHHHWSFHFVPAEFAAGTGLRLGNSETGWCPILVDGPDSQIVGIVNSQNLVTGKGLHHVVESSTNSLDHLENLGHQIDRL